MLVFDELLNKINERENEMKGADSERGREREEESTKHHFLFWPLLLP